MLNAILIIDDDLDILQAAELALREEARRIDLASSPDGIAMLVSKHAYDVVLLDMNFSTGAREGQEGLDLIGAIRAVDPAVSIILLTAFGGVSLAIEALKRGGNDLILKPWNNEKLVEAVRAGAQRRSTEGEASLQLDTLERRAISAALQKSSGNLSKAAGLLGLTRPALYRRLAKHGF